MRKNYTFSLLKLVAVLLLILQVSSVNAAKFNFASTDVFADVLATMADGDTLVLTTPGTTAYYTALNGAITKSITIMADPSLTSRPVLSTNSVGACFTPTNTGSFTKIEFLGIEAFAIAPTDVVVDSRYFLDGRMTTGSITTLKFKNCYIHGYSRCVVRADGSTPVFTNLVVDSCVFYDNSIGAASYPTFGLKSATVTNISITNSTFYNGPGNVMTYSKTNALTFLMKNCNIIDCGSFKTRILSGAVYIDSNPGRLIDFTAAANASSTFTIDNCIISGKYTNKDNRPLADQANTGTYVGSDIVRFNTATAANVNFINSIILDNTFNTPATPGGTYSPITCTSLTNFFPSLHIFTDPNTITGIGDPRWKLNLNNDTTLSKILIDGTIINGFAYNKFTYNVVLPYGTTTIPVVTTTSTDPSLSPLITQATAVDGSATIVVAAKDGISTATYTVKFSVALSNDATLKDLKVDNVSVTGFASGTYIYDVVLPVGTTAKPVIAATINGANATTIITQADSVVGTATVVVTAEDATTKLTYTVNFTVAPSIVTNPSSLYFDDLNAKDSLTVSGSYLKADITITAPAGITVNPATIPMANAANVKVYVTYDSTTVVNDSITLTSGTLVKKVAVKASSNAGCYTPLYATGNLIADPGFNAATFAAGGFGGWGPTVLSKTNLYCGRGSAFIRGSCWPNGGSLDRGLSKANGNALKALTTYRLRAMVNSQASAGTTFQFEIEGYDGAASKKFQIGNTNGWKQIDTAFTTGATVIEKGIYFNSCTNPPAITDTCFIDNYEMYNITPYATLSDLTVNGITVSGFDSTIYNYNVVATNIPTVAATEAVAGAVVNVTQATAIPGSAIVKVTSADGYAINTYTINFTSVSTDASLSALTVSAGTLKPVFNSATYTYYVELPSGSAIPTVIPTTTDTKANAIIAAATAIPDTTIVKVTAEDGTTTNTYLVNFWDLKLTGAVIGHTSSWNDDPATYVAAAFDGNTATFVDAPTAAGYVGLDLGAGKKAKITSMRYFPRISMPARMVGGEIRGANNADLSDSVVLYKITTQPSTVNYTDVILSVANSYRYIYYYSANGYCNIAELELYGVTTSISTDATLSDLKVGGTTISGFASGTLTYDVVLPIGTTVVPTVSATVNESNANTVITQAPSVTGSATVVVTAQDGTTKLTYTINFSIDVYAPTVNNISLITVEPTISSNVFVVKFACKPGTIKVIDSRGVVVSIINATSTSEAIGVPSAGIYILQITACDVLKTVKVVKTN